MSLSDIESKDAFKEDSFLLNSENPKIEDFSLKNNWISQNKPFNNKNFEFKLKSVIESLSLKKYEIKKYLDYLFSIKTQIDDLFGISLLEIENKKKIFMTKLELCIENYLSNIRKLEYNKTKWLEKKEAKLKIFLNEIESLSKLLNEKNTKKEDLKAAFVLANKFTHSEVKQIKFPLEWLKAQSISICFEELLKDCFRTDGSLREMHIQTGKNRTSSQKKWENYEKNWKNQEKSKNIEIKAGNYNKNDIKISRLYSDHLNHDTDLFGDCIKVYIPNGKPAYSNYYIIKNIEKLKVQDLIEAINDFTGGSWDYLGIKNIDGEKLKVLKPEIQIFKGNESKYCLGEF